MSSSSSSTSSSIILTTSSSSRDFSSSSSFGDAASLFYFLDINKDVYLSSSDGNSIRSSLVFKTFNRVVGEPRGLAISFFIDEQSSESSVSLQSSSSSISSITESESSLSSKSVESSSSSSTSSSRSSESSPSSSSSSQKFDFTASNVYILAKDVNNTSNIGVYSLDGRFKGLLSFVSSYDFLGLSVWPSNDNLLIASSSNNIHFLYINGGQVLSYITEMPTELDNGLCFSKVINENESEFIALTKDNEMVTFRINISTREVEVISYTSYDNLIGVKNGLVIASDGKIYFSREDDGRSLVYKTDGVSSSILDVVNYNIYGMAYPTTGAGEASVGDSSKIISVISREYDGSGNFLNSSNSVFFGLLQPGKISSTRIVNLLVDGASLIDNVRIGIIRAEVGDIDVKEVFLVEHSSIIDPSIEMQHYFPGVNSSEDPDSIYNVWVGAKASVDGKQIESNYVYLAVNVPDKYTTRGHCIYKWFFDFED